MYNRFLPSHVCAQHIPLFCCSYFPSSFRCDEIHLFYIDEAYSCLVAIRSRIEWKWRYTCMCEHINQRKEVIWFDCSCCVRTTVPFQYFHIAVCTLYRKERMRKGRRFRRQNKRAWIKCRHIHIYTNVAHTTLTDEQNAHTHTLTKIAAFGSAIFHCLSFAII